MNFSPKMMIAGPVESKRVLKKYSFWDENLGLYQNYNV
jgi:hypothetical protein